MKKENSKKQSNKKGEDMKLKILELEESLKRAQADFINYRRRVNEDRIAALKYEGSSMLLSLLPVFDNLDRAFQHIPKELESNDWVKGIVHIEQYFLKILGDLKVNKIECLGMPADYNFHDVIDKKPGKKDIILDVIEDGYIYNDKVLRPAKVIVGSEE